MQAFLFPLLSGLQTTRVLGRPWPRHQRAPPCRLPVRRLQEAWHEARGSTGRVAMPGAGADAGGSRGRERTGSGLQPETQRCPQLGPITDLGCWAPNGTRGTPKEKGWSPCHPPAPLRAGQLG